MKEFNDQQMADFHVQNALNEGQIYVRFSLANFEGKTRRAGQTGGFREPVPGKEGIRVYEQKIPSAGPGRVSGRRTTADSAEEETHVPERSPLLRLGDPAGPRAVARERNPV